MSRMVSTFAESPNDLDIGHAPSSKAMFIAEILAGCAAMIMAISIVCCFCSGAARRRARHGGSQQTRYLLSSPTNQEMLENGRQTPDFVAPAYTTSSPIGPLSPEVVDAISRVSIECRHSLVISILSSDSSFCQQQQQLQQLQLNSGQRDSDSIMTQLQSGASSMVGQQNYQDSDAGRNGCATTLSPPGSVLGESIHETINTMDTTYDPTIMGSPTQARPLISLSDLTALPNVPPPSYDPRWRTTSLTGSASPTSARRHLRPIPLNATQNHSRNRLSLSSIPDRHSLDSPASARTRQQHQQQQQQQQQQPSMSSGHSTTRCWDPKVHWKPSGRSISWTGAIIRFGGGGSNSSACGGSGASGSSSTSSASGASGTGGTSNSSATVGPAYSPSRTATTALYTQRTHRPMPTQTSVMADTRHSNSSSSSDNSSSSSSSSSSSIASTSHQQTSISSTSTENAPPSSNQHLHTIPDP
ncbi:hypothetical protein BGZ94_005821 [Podila epigama]|nr:hypothetical protein BGZ94_005821 [Podila epigama]